MSVRLRLEASNWSGEPKGSGKELGKRWWRGPETEKTAKNGKSSMNFEGSENKTATHSRSSNWRRSNVRIRQGRPFAQFDYTFWFYGGVREVSHHQVGVWGRIACHVSQKLEVSVFWTKDLHFPRAVLLTDAIESCSEWGRERNKTIRDENESQTKIQRWTRTHPTPCSPNAVKLMISRSLLWGSRRCRI